MTLVNISLQDGWPDIYRVPLLCTKINRINGESIDPEPGDQVAVAFINGNFYNPVVIGFLPQVRNTLQPETADAPLHHTHWQGSDYRYEKDGTRRAYVAKDDVLEVEGNGTVLIHGTMDVHVVGNATIRSDAVLRLAAPEVHIHANNIFRFDVNGHGQKWYPDGTETWCDNDVSKPHHDHAPPEIS
jgi:phage baseplate assembly protein gpV